MISRNSLIYWHDVMSAATVQATHNHIHISYIMHHQPAQSYKIRWTHGTVCAQLHWQQQKNKRRRVDDSDFHMNGSSSGFFGSILPANNTLNRWQHTKLIIIKCSSRKFCAMWCDVMWLSSLFGNCFRYENVEPLLAHNVSPGIQWYNFTYAKALACTHTYQPFRGAHTPFGWIYLSLYRRRRRRSLIFVHDDDGCCHTICITERKNEM